MRDWASAKLAGLEKRLTSRNSEMGRRFANRVESDWERMLEKRSPKLNREVIASIGSWIGDIVRSKG